MAATPEAVNLATTQTAPARRRDALPVMELPGVGVSDVVLPTFTARADAAAQDQGAPQPTGMPITQK